MTIKTKVSGSQVVKDIRAGMDDAGLMKKYKLSAKGLQSLFQKLLALRHLTPAEMSQRMSADGESGLQPAAQGSSEWQGIDFHAVIDDIRAGMHDFDLAEKYSLSLRELQDLFGQLLRSGLLEQADFDQRTPYFDSTVDLTGKITGLGGGGFTEAAPPSPDKEELIDLTWECPVCGIFQSRDYAKCPECGALVALLRRKK